MPASVTSRRRTTVRQQSLRTKIIAWSFVPTAIILAIVAWAIFYTYQRVTEQLVIERDRELTRLIADELAREFAEYDELFSILARPQDGYKKDAVIERATLNQTRSVVAPRIIGSGRVYLVDTNGRIIYDSQVERVGEDVSSQPIVQKALKGEVGALRTHNVDGQEIVASYAPVIGTGSALITEESWNELIEPSRKYQKLLLALLMLGVIAPTLVILIGARRITRPIEALTCAAQEVAGGNFDQIITANTGDELEELAKQFNRMAAQLQESYSDLERKVADRTQELAALNAIAASVNESLDLDQTLDRALDEMLDLLNLEVGEIRLLDPDRKELVIRTHHGLSLEFVRLNNRLKINGTLPGQVLLSGQSIIYEDVVNATGEIWAREEGVRAIAICVLQAKEKRLGTLTLATRHGPRRFSHNERELLRAVSDQVGVAIENARLYQQAQQLAVIEERNRLARDLHDSVTQSLYGVTLFAEASGRLLSLGDTQLAIDHLHELQQTAQEALLEMRLLIFELRPSILVHKGLAAALKMRLENVEERLGLETSFQLEGENKQISPEIEQELYRIAQEALNNALKHAQAHHVSVYLCQDRPMTILEIADDGIGFDPSLIRQRGGLGLLGMKERAAQLGAKLSIQSWPAEGTRVRVEVQP